MTRRPERAGRPDRREALAIGGLLVVALLLRLPLALHGGEFDADQGRDMIAARGIVRDGERPIVGPETSIGVGRHGVLYFYLIAPVAALNGADDPGPVQGLFLAIGLATVLAVWALGRTIGGPSAGLLAALLATLAATTIHAATTIWNPNVTPLGSALAFIGALLARRGSPRWWLLAGLGALLAAQGHIVAGLIAIPLGVLLVAAIAQAPRGRRRPVALAGAGAVAIFLAGYVPFLVHDALGGFAELREILAYAASGGAGGSVPDPLGPIGRLVLAVVRIGTTPLVGPLAGSPAAAAVATGVLAGLGVLAVRRAQADRTALAAIGLATLACALFLALVLRQSTVVPGLPTDHFHAWLDPLVLAVCGTGLAALARGRGAGRTLGRLATGALLAAFAWWNLVAAPPRPAEDDWASVRRVARILVEDGRRDVAVAFAPAFKGADAFEYALAVAGHPSVAPAAAGRVAIVCERTLVRGCGGDAEEAALAAAVGGERRRVLRLVSRWEAGAGRLISVYEAAP